MTAALVAVIMSILELVELWTGWVPAGITTQWVETTLMILAPILIWLVPRFGGTQLWPPARGASQNR